MRGCQRCFRVAPGHTAPKGGRPGNIFFPRLRLEGAEDEIGDEAKDVGDNYYLEDGGEKMIEHDEIPLWIVPVGSA